MRRKFKFLFILVPIAFIALAGSVTMGLWNWLMPALFGLTAITFVKAAGLFLFARLLFGSRGGWRSRRFAFAGHRHHMNREEWQQKMQEKWQNFSPEQRAKFSGRCGGRYDFSGAERKEENTTETK